MLSTSLQEKIIVNGYFGILEGDPDAGITLATRQDDITVDIYSHYLNSPRFQLKYFIDSVSSELPPRENQFIQSLIRECYAYTFPVWRATNCFDCSKILFQFLKDNPSLLKGRTFRRVISTGHGWIDIINADGEIEEIIAFDPTGVSLSEVRDPFLEDYQPYFGKHEYAPDRLRDFYDSYVLRKEEYSDNSTVLYLNEVVVGSGEISQYILDL